MCVPQDITHSACVVHGICGESTPRRDINIVSTGYTRIPKGYTVNPVDNMLCNVDNIGYNPVENTQNISLG